MLRTLILIAMAIASVSAGEVHSKEHQVPVLCGEGWDNFDTPINGAWCHDEAVCEGQTVKDLCPHGNHFQCCVPKEKEPHLRITLIKARVMNVDGNVGLTPYDPETDDFEEWTYVKGATDPQIVLKVGKESDSFENFAEVESDWKSNTLTPTFMEMFTFGPQPATAELYWAIYDKNLNPLDGVNTLGERKLIAEGREPMSKFRGTNEVHTFTDPKTNQAVTLRISWSAKTGAGCPEGAIHPRKVSNFFFRDESMCVCDKKYTFLGESGHCEPYPAWIKTCGNFGKKYCGSKRRNGKSMRCVDSDFGKLESRCEGGKDDKCHLFKCRSKN